MNHKKILLLLAALGLSFAVYCDPNYFGRALTRNSSINPTDSTTDVLPCPTGADCTKDYFSNVLTWPPQDTQTTAVGADFMFVIDMSGSMASVKTALKASLVSWMGTLDNLNLPNYCISLLPAVTTSKSGEIVGAGGHTCFCRDQLSVAEIQEFFQSAVATAEGNSLLRGDGNATSESGHLAVHNALTTKLATNQASGECLQTLNSLVVTYVADENDIIAAHNGAGLIGMSTLSNSSVVAKSSVVFDDSWTKYGQGGWDKTNTSANNYNSRDQGGPEFNERIKYVNPVPDGISGKYSNLITSDTVVDEIKAFNGSLPTTGGAVVFPVGGNAVFATNNAQGPGHGYIESADLFGQDIIDISIANPSTQTEFNTKMNQYAQSLVSSIAYQRVFDLLSSTGTQLEVCEGQEASLVVKVNDTALAASKYTLDTNRQKVTIVPSVSFHNGDIVSITFTSCQ